MSRARRQAYRSSDLSDLARQLLYTPPARRAEVVRNAEQLHDAMEHGKNYPFDFLVYRLTGRRIPPRESVMLVGEAIMPDLRLLIDALSRSIQMRCDPSDPSMTTRELAESLGVSAKTVARWRDRGLRWRWGIRAGKPTVLIPRSAVTAFDAHQAGRVNQAKSFCRLTGDEQSRLLRRARRLAIATQATPQAIHEHLAKRTGRSHETIRQLVRRHDAERPDDAIFDSRRSPLTEKQKRVIDRAYRRGVLVSALCDRYHKTRSTIYRVIHEARASRIQATPISYIDSPLFDRADVDEVLSALPQHTPEARRLGNDVIAWLPQALEPIYDRPIQPDDVTRSLVVRYNFLKRRAALLRDRLAVQPLRAEEMNQFDELWRRIGVLRGEVLSATLPIVLSVVLRDRPPAKRGVDEPSAFLARLHAGQSVLLDEIDRFDPSLAHRFEAVVTNRLLRVLANPPAQQIETDAEALINQLRDAGFGTSA